MKSAKSNNYQPKSFSMDQECPHQISDLSARGDLIITDTEENGETKSPNKCKDVQHVGGQLSPFHFSAQESIYRSLSSNYFHELSEKSSELKNSLATLLVIPAYDVDILELQRIIPTSIAVYEERQLYNLLLLCDNPNFRIIYVSSESISEDVIGYYLRLRSNQDNWRDQLSRLTMLSINDSSFPTPLSQKILNRPQLLTQIREIIFQNPLESCTDYESTEHKIYDHDKYHYIGLSVYTGSTICSCISHALRVPLLEADQAYLHWGTKQGSREIFCASNIPFPRGTPDRDCHDYGTLLTPLPADSFLNVLHNTELYPWENKMRYIRSTRDLSIGLARQIILKNVRPQRWMIKLNQGFCGRCNATLDLTELQNDPRYKASILSEMTKISSTDATFLLNDNVNEKIIDLALNIERRLPLMQFMDPSLSWENPSNDADHPGFHCQMQRLGVIAEELIENVCSSVATGDQAVSIRSPSFQGVISEDDKCDGSTPKRSVHIVSTHEQILQGLMFVGCKMPASEPYRTQLIEYGLKIGSELADHGAIGHFSVDFLAIPRLDVDHSNRLIKWELVAIEINLRQGGTTHPHAVMEILVGGGSMDESDGMFKTHDGNNPRYYVATDGFKDPLLTNLSAKDLICAIESEDNPTARLIHWDKNSLVGTVFHLFRALKPEGRIGFTCIGATEEQAESMFKSTIRFLLDLAASKVVDGASTCL